MKPRRNNAHGANLKFTLCFDLYVSPVHNGTFYAPDATGRFLFNHWQQSNRCFLNPKLKHNQNKTK